MFTFSGTATVLAAHRLAHSRSGFTPIMDVAIRVAFALGVVVAVSITAEVSGAHVNPAVTLSLVAVGQFPWRQVPGYLVARWSAACSPAWSTGSCSPRCGHR